MKLYLSSYKLGNHTDELKKLVGKSDASVAVIDNALDYSTDLIRKAQSLENELNDIRSLGFNPQHIDLREYFENNTSLVDELSKFDAVWIRGGNSFILRKAMQQSGFDRVIETLVKPGKLVYAGYSAAVAVVAPSLRGVELVDDIHATAKGYDNKIIWDGYGLIDFYPIVHYQSDHPESELVEKELEHVKSMNMKYKTLRDGDVIIVCD